MEPVSTAATIKSFVVPALKWAAPRVLSAVGSYFGTKWAGDEARKRDRRQNRANLQMQNLAFQQNKEMVNLQNQYNTPLAQMQRYKDAGLNPNLIYGQGTPGNQSQIAQYQAPRMESSVRPNIDPVAMLSNYQDMAQKSESLRHAEAMTDLNRQQTLNAMEQQYLIAAQAAGAYTDAQVKDREMDMLAGTWDSRKALIEAEAFIKHKQAQWAANGLDSNSMGFIRASMSIAQLLRDVPGIGPMVDKFLEYAQETLNKYSPTKVPETGDWTTTSHFRSGNPLNKTYTSPNIKDAEGEIFMYNTRIPTRFKQFKPRWMKGRRLE